MPNPQVRPFSSKDLALLNASPEIKTIFARATRQRKPFAAVVELAYGDIVWADRKLGFNWPHDADLGEFASSMAPVVAMVTKRTMEVYETVDVRKRTTVVLRPGDWFGLFEAYADWLGPWTIVSGVLTLLPCNSIGNTNNWLRQPAKEQVQARPGYALEYDKILVPIGPCRNAWTSESVWVKPDLIKDNEAKNQLVSELHQKTIHQLRSALNQSPTWGRIGQKNGNLDMGDIKGYLWMQYLNSVIDGDVPIFQLADQEGETYFPVSVALDTLASQYRNVAITPREILVPKVLNTGSRGIHPVAYVPRFPPSGEECLLKWDEQRILTLARNIGRDISNLSLKGRHFASAHYGENTKVTVCSLREAKKHPIDLLAPDDVERKRSWHRHLNRVVIIEKYDPSTLDTA